MADATSEFKTDFFQKGTRFTTLGGEEGGVQKVKRNEAREDALRVQKKKEWKTRMCTIQPVETIRDVERNVHFGDRLHLLGGLRIGGARGNSPTSAKCLLVCISRLRKKGVG